MQAVAKLGQQAQARESEEGDRVAPRVHGAPVVVAHLGLDPMQPIGEAELLQDGLEIGVRDAVEMIVALDPDAAEVKAGRHPADAVIGLEHHGPPAVAHELVGHPQPHRPRPEHGHAVLRHRAPLHQNSSAILLYTGSPQVSSIALANGVALTAKMRSQSITSKLSPATSAASCSVVKGGSLSN